jgi:hypothetical protein
VLPLVHKVVSAEAISEYLRWRLVLCDLASSNSLGQLHELLRSSFTFGKLTYFALYYFSSTLLAKGIKQSSWILFVMPFSFPVLHSSNFENASVQVSSSRWLRRPCFVQPLSFFGKMGRMESQNPLLYDERSSERRGFSTHRPRWKSVHLEDGSHWRRRRQSREPDRWLT